MKKYYGDLIEELEENGYINDKEYISKCINEYKTLNNLSIKEIKYKLYSKGIRNSLIEDYISENIEDLLGYELDSAKKIAIKKSNTMDKDKIAQYLLKKGYLGESVKYAIQDEN